GDGDERVADRAGSRQALPLQPDLLAVAEPGRDLHLDILAGRKMHPARAALGRLRQRDGDRDFDIAADRRLREVRLEMLRAESAAPAARGAAETEHVLEHVLEAGRSRAACSRAARGA